VSGERLSVDLDDRDAVAEPLVGNAGTTDVRTDLDRTALDRTDPDR